MTGTEFLDGQGLGNQLFCYISSRCLALDYGYAFGTANQKQFGHNIHTQEGVYFMDVDLGPEMGDVSQYTRVDEKDERLFLNTCAHDRTHGCYVTGCDNKLRNELPDNSLIYGNLQDERYFYSHKQEIKSWLRVRPEYDSHEFTEENLCVIHFRGGDYTNGYTLLLTSNYYNHAIEHMRRIKSNMRFIIVTDDPKLAKYVMPGIPAYRRSLGEDYAAIKNARYLILSNSSFAVFPALTSDVVQKIIAPKYWARHNVSNGYWSGEQNIYSDFTYQDRKGNLFTAEECRKELAAYKTRTDFENRINDRSRADKPFGGLERAYYGALSAIDERKKSRWLNNR